VLYHGAVRRASAFSLLAALFYSLVAPTLFADSESVLPQCCRRAGEHRCAMKTDNAAPTGPEFRLVQNCPACPAAQAATTDSAAAVLKTSNAIFAGLVSHPAVQCQTEALGRISFSRSRQKRGPPAPLA